ncbi:MAG: HAD hydrolase family protein [Candidatus Rokubacteria bacterium]|nr:HAD hydrolase family protein [Candidatus Rokubacteria bacterium]
MLALDIDGVLTDGRVTLDESGHESKTLSYCDIDAVFTARRRGVRVVLVTGEDTPWVDMVAKRLEVDAVYRGVKDKRMALRRLGADFAVSPDTVCYIGDSQRDAEAFAEVGLALAPADAADAAQQGARHVLARRGGAGAVREAVELILGVPSPADGGRPDR